MGKSAELSLSACHDWAVDMHAATQYLHRVGFWGSTACCEANPPAAVNKQAGKWQNEHSG